MSERASAMPRVLRAVGFMAGWSVLLALVGLLLAVFMVPRVAGAESFTVLSGSMRPALDPGDLVVVRPTDAEDVGIGSVVTFQVKSGDPAVTTHRVVSQGLDKNGNSVFLTRGDENESADPVWIREAQLRGEVWYTVPYVGYLAQAMPSNLRQLLAGAVGAGLLIYGVVMLTLAVRERTGTRHA